jgi:hypothetical protein
VTAVYCSNRGVRFLDTGAVFSVVMNCFLAEVCVGVSSSPFPSFCYSMWWAGSEQDARYVREGLVSESDSSNSLLGPTIDSSEYKAAAALGYRRCHVEHHDAVSVTSARDLDFVSMPALPSYPAGMSDAYRARVSANVRVIERMRSYNVRGDNDVVIGPFAVSVGSDAKGAHVF